MQNHLLPELSSRAETICEINFPVLLYLWSPACSALAGDAVGWTWRLEVYEQPMKKMLKWFLQAGKIAEGSEVVSQTTLLSSKFE